MDPIGPMFFAVSSIECAALSEALRLKGIKKLETAEMNEKEEDEIFVNTIGAYLGQQEEQGGEAGLIAPGECHSQLHACVCLNVH